MADKCLNDGGFIGEGGCTHPNHEHSDLVKRLMTSETPVKITAAECDAALDEGFTVKTLAGSDAKFGRTLKAHIESHLQKGLGNDVEARKSRLAYAIHAVRHTKPEENHRGIEGRRAYVYSSKDVGVLVLTDKTGETIDDVFDIIPKRALKKRGGL